MIGSKSSWGVVDSTSCWLMSCAAAQTPNRHSEDAWVQHTAVNKVALVASFPARRPARSQ